MNRLEPGWDRGCPTPSVTVTARETQEALHRGRPTEARIAERSLQIRRADLAVQLALRVAPSTIPADNHGAAKRLVRLVFSVKRDMPAA